VREFHTYEFTEKNPGCWVRSSITYSIRWHLVWPATMFLKRAIKIFLTYMEWPLPLCSRFLVMEKFTSYLRNLPILYILLNLLRGFPFWWWFACSHVPCVCPWSFSCKLARYTITIMYVCQVSLLFIIKVYVNSTAFCFLRSPEVHHAFFTERFFDWPLIASMYVRCNYSLSTFESLNLLHTWKYELHII